MASLAPNVLVHEYISGGGWPEPELPKGLAGEGLAMLRAVLADFRAWGGAKVTTTRDRRLAEVSLAADRVVDLAPENHSTVLEQLAGQCTAALIIAPETDGILARLSALMESRGVRLLGSSPHGVAVAADKWECHQRFIQAGLPTPDTWRVNRDGARKTAEKIGFPLVIKPVDGVGCEGVSLIPDAFSLHLALEKTSLYGNYLLLQRYIDGDHASASLLVAGNDILCLSLNRQSIEIGTPFSYQGGVVPFTRVKHKEAIGLAKCAAALVPGLKGYIGVDILITDKGCYLIEINPRLTTSYIGLRQVVNINLVKAIWGASIREVLPREVFLSGKATFRKENLI